jgi:hypothetical protein
MSKVSIGIMAVAIFFVVVQLGLMLFNRPLFCRIALLGGIGQSPQYASLKQ